MEDLLKTKEKYGDIHSEEVFIYSEEDERAEVLKHPITWDSLGDTYAPKKDMQRMKDYVNDHADKLAQFVAHGSTYAKLFMVLLARLIKDEDIRYVVTLLDDLLKLAQNSKNPQTDLTVILGFFHKLQKGKPDSTVPPPPFGPIFAVLSRKTEDVYTLTLASRILTTFITKLSDVPQETVESAFHWFVDELLSKDHANFRERKISLGLVGLRPLLAVNEYRALFVSDTIRGLPTLMNLSTFEDKREGVILSGKPSKKPTKAEIKRDGDKKTPDFQQIYEAVYCLWCLSFNSEAQQKLTEPKLIYNLCHILKRCNKVKVIRISLATLRNLLGVEKNNELMLSYGIMSSLALLKQKRWGDEELENDIKEIEENLEKNVDDLTSWDRYKNEVVVHQLDWTPPHKSPKFWKDHHLKFEEDDYLILTILKDILEHNSDQKVLAIACWDIGEFVRVHPNGKLICKNMGLKGPIMHRLNEAEKNADDEESRKLAKEALTALQKLMITNWEYLQ